MNNFLLTIALIVAVACIALWRRAALRAAKLNVDIEALKSSAARDIEALQFRIDALERQVSRLSKWEKVADADAAASALILEAEAEAASLKAHASAIQQAAEAEAATIRRTAEDEASAIRNDARSRAAALTSHSATRLADAEQRATAIIDRANRQAEDIAGDALRAVNEAKALERTVQALKNVIEGYGDRYIVPTQSLLDDLAEGFAHTDAGQKLKLVREHVRNAVKSGKAATCDYVEENRRATATRFVVDAFNGKVESILAKLRQDNFGKLLQELKDAFNLVNHNGRAFRNARINDAFLAMREEELRWAVVLHELKQQEREEQRRIKEQIREEERARREFDRAIRETAREEELVRKAMEKAEAQLARASQEQRLQYEMQLQELQVRLR